MITKLQFLLFYSVFLFFVMQISAMAGVSLIKGLETPTPPSQPSGIIDALGWVVGNIGYFFKLFRVSTEFALFGTLILIPFFVVLIAVIIEWIRGV